MLTRLRPVIALRSTVKHLHIVGNDLSRIALYAILLPLTGAQAAFDVYLAALLHVLADDLRQLAREHHVVPLRAFLAFAGTLIGPVFRRRQRQVAERIAIRKVLQLRILTDIADQDDFVNAFCHVSS